ncbi:MAG: hypothetical protein AAF511_07415 [Pseudomonadota bacterium]
MLDDGKLAHRRPSALGERIGEQPPADGDAGFFGNLLNQGGLGSMPFVATRVVASVPYSAISVSDQVSNLSPFTKTTSASAGASATNGW